MHIGISGPISLAPLAKWLTGAERLPAVYSFPLIGQLAAELLDRGHTVTVFAGSTEIDKVVRYCEGPLTLMICPRRRARNAYDLYRLECSSLQKQMQSSDCDIIHAHWTYEFAEPALESGIPALITAHDAPLAIQRYFITTKAGPFWIMRMLLAAKVLRRTKHLTTVSPYVARHIRRWFRRGRSIEVIPNGIPDRIFELGRARLAKTVASDGPIVVAAVLEGFSDRKNAKGGLRAFAIFLRHRPTARLRLYGSNFGPGEAAEKWARTHGLHANVEFRGHTHHDRLVQELAKEATVLLHPSLEEAHPMAICEAMALGIPVIGGRKSGGVPFTLDEGRVGYLTDVSDPQAMSDTLVSAAEDAARRNKMANLAWNHAHQNFRLSHMVDLYEAEYQKILSVAPMSSSRTTHQQS